VCGVVQCLFQVCPVAFDDQLPAAQFSPAAPEPEPLEAYATQLASFKARGTPPAGAAARLLRALA